MDNKVLDSVPEHKERSPLHTWGTSWWRPQSRPWLSVLVMGCFQYMLVCTEEHKGKTQKKLSSKSLVKVATNATGSRTHSNKKKNNILALVLINYKSEAFLSLGESRVRPEQDALIKVSHRLVHLVQQDFQLRGNGDFRQSTTALIKILQTIAFADQSTNLKETSSATTWPLWW